MAVPVPNPFRRLGILRPSADVPDADESTRVAIRVRPRDEERKLEDLGASLRKMASTLPHLRKHLSAEQWVRRFGAAKEDLEQVATFARRMGLEVETMMQGERSVVLRGPLSRVQKALGVEVHTVEDGEQSFRTHDGPVLVPKSLADTIESVRGLETIPVFHRRPRIAERTRGNFPVRRVAELYGFPLEHRGKGQTAVILLLGGGFHRQDLETYFRGIKLGVPQIDVVELAGAKNQPASNKAIQQVLHAQGFEPRPVPVDPEAPDPCDSAANVAWTIEATTDIEILGSLIPEARLVVVFAPNTQDEQAAAIETILGSEFEAQYGCPSVISCSWGQYEYRMKSSSMHAMETALERAATMGVTVCFASGDYGGGPVYYPASSAYALACGGTSIVSAPGDDEVREEVWREERLALYFSASGGGASEAFAVPDWQKGAVATWGGAKRGVPDIAAQASLASGYALIIGAAEVGMGGTSAAAPLIAGLVVQINEANQDLKKGYRVGWLTPLLYGKDFADAFVSITRGNNGLFVANPRWDPCTGLGRPIGKRLLAALRAGK
ncbi:MAG: S8/S53 family peptidase [Acidobacteria bacterium]|nr:S8/S53 family peptidase [Acidobacteriota bacterium]